MKLSQVPREELESLSVEQATRIVFGYESAPDRPAVAALLLGGAPQVMDARVRAAAALWREGLAPLVVPTGGVAHDVGGVQTTEVEYMARGLLAEGVPEEAILREDQATTTRENMIYGEVLLERTLHPRGPFAVYVVTSGFHLRRSLAIAKLYLPRTATAIGRAAPDPGGGPDDWMRSEYYTMRVRKEVGLDKWMVDQREMDDIEF